MALASERVEHDGAPGGRNARIEVPHVGCKSAAFSQNLSIARRERKSPLVCVTRLREVEGAVRNHRQCEVGLRQIRREDKRLARIRLRLLKAFTRRRFGLGVLGDDGKGERSPDERERIVRIEADRFRVRSNRSGEVFAVAYRACCLCPAQIRIEGGRIARAAELDFGPRSPRSVTFKALATAVAISV